MSSGFWRAVSIGVRVIAWGVVALGLIVFVVPVDTDTTPPVECHAPTVVVLFTGGRPVESGQTCRDAAAELAFGAAILVGAGLATLVVERALRKRHRPTEPDSRPRPLAGDLRFDSFAFSRPPLGRTHAVAEVDARKVRLVNAPFMREPLDIPLSSIAAIVRLPSPEPVEAPVLRRRARCIALGVDRNVALVFKSPVRVPRFRFGAEKSLPISARERRTGVALDVIAVSLAEPDAFVASLAAKGLVVSDRVTPVLARLVGELHGPHATRARLERARARNRRLALVTVLGLAWVALWEARFAIGDGAHVSPTRVAALVASSLIWAAGAAALSSRSALPILKPLSRSPRTGAQAVRRFVAMLTGMLALFAVPLSASLVLVRGLGAPGVVVYGMVAGVPGGLILGAQLAMVRGGGSTPLGRGDFARPSSRGSRD